MVYVVLKKTICFKGKNKENAIYIEFFFSFKRKEKSV
jgi:hypothetical protein